MRRAAVVIAFAAFVTGAFSAAAFRSARDERGAEAETAPAPSTNRAPATAPATAPGAASQPANAVANAPEGEVGLVRTILADKSYASARVRNAEKWKVNDEVVLSDAEGNVLAKGVVRRVVKDSVHIKYELARKAARPPAFGDTVRRTGKARPAPGQRRAS